MELAQQIRERLSVRDDLADFFSIYGINNLHPTNMHSYLYRKIIPIVRVALVKGEPEDFAKGVGDFIYRTMLDTINVAVKNNFQIKRELSL